MFQVDKLLTYMKDTWVGHEDSKMMPKYPIKEWSAHRSITDVTIPDSTFCTHIYNSNFKAAIREEECNVWKVIHTIKVS